MNANIQELAQTLFEEAGDAIFLFDPENGQIIDVNPMAQRLCAASRPDLLKDSIDSLFRSEHQGGTNRLRRAYQHTGTFHSQDGFFLRQKTDGSWIPVNLTVARLHVKPKTRGLITARDVSERRRSEAALRESDAFKRAVLESALDCIITIDHQGRVIEFNPAAEKTFGYSREKALGQSLAELIIPPASRSAHSHGLANYLNAGQGAILDRRIEVTALRADGSELPVELTITAIRTTKHPVFTAFLRDITERKRAEAGLRERENLLHNLITHIPCAVFWKDRNSVYVGCNDQVARDHGLDSAAQVVGGTDYDLEVAPGEADFYRECDRQVMEAGEPIMNLEETQTRAGVRAVLLTSKVPLRDSTGAVVGVLGVYQDITDRKKLEDRYHQAQQRLTQILASSPAILFTLKIERGRIQGISWISDNVRNVFGYSPEEAGDPDWWIENIHAEDRDKVIADIRDRLFAQDYAVHEYRFRHKDGNYRWTRGEFRLARDAAGQAVEAVGTWSDITDQRQLEEQLRQAQKMEAIGQLAGGVAHDFNNLLTIINGYSDLLLQNVPFDDPSREPLVAIRKAGEQSAGLTRQLLAFSRRQVLAPRLLDLNAAMTDIEKMLRRLIGEDISLVSVLDPAVGAVRADPVQIEQILLNLAVNARDAMPAGGRLTIETRNVNLHDAYAATHLDARLGPHVLLAVSDTGCGMPPEVKAKIFEPFFTTKGVGKGTGLGLATVYGIVQQSGGHISAYSEVGVGTTFEVYLPREDVPAVALKCRSGMMPPPTGTETVLIVEDEDGVRGLTRCVLMGCGYTVLEASEAEEALKIAAEHSGPLHLLISDVVMPGLGGRMVANRVTELHPNMRVLFVSGYPDDAVVRHGVVQDGVNFLQKPFSPVALARKVREVLDSAPPASDCLPIGITKMALSHF